MKRGILNFLGIFTALVMFSGCGNAAINGPYLTVLDTSDFTPPIGRPENPAPKSSGERRLLTATSTDGEHFTATGKILTDQGGVPDILVEEDGTIRVYYIGQTIEEGKEENTVVAISKDNGATWEFKKLTFKNFTQQRDPADPDVVLLDDGTYRMYYTASLDTKNKIGILYADSPDGITFTYKGESLRGTESIIDSTTLFFDGLWHMYVLQEKAIGQLYATSVDGLKFTFTSEPEVKLPMGGYVISNALIEGDEVRMFGFNLKSENIRTFTTSDMTNWTAGDIAIEGSATANLGSSYIQDLSVVQLQDGSYFMVYVSEMPE